MNLTLQLIEFLFLLNVKNGGKEIFTFFLKVNHFSLKRRTCRLVAVDRNVYER